MRNAANHVNVDAVKDGVDIRDVISRYLGPPRDIRRPKWICPFHDDKRPSLSLTPDLNAFICWSCGAKGDVIAFVGRMEGLGFIDTIERISGGGYDAGARPDRLTEINKANAIEGQRRTAAQSLCREAEEIGGTLAERYLRETRRIGIPLPPSLKFHPEVPANILHLVEPLPNTRFLPALVAELATMHGEVTGAHVIYLRTVRGRVEKASMEKPKLSFGSCRGTSVHLSETGPTLGSAEGIEDSLSVIEMARVPMWAAPGTSFLSLMLLPDTVTDLHIYGQSDKPGRLAADQSRESHSMPGRTVTTHFPPAEGKDWNALLISRKQQ